MAHYDLLRKKYPAFAEYERRIEQRRNKPITIAYADFCAAAVDSPNAERYEYDYWSGGTWADLQKLMRQGDHDNVRRLEARINEIETEIATEGTAAIIAADVQGFAPIVPAYLAGVPETMARYETITDNRGPVTIVVDIGAVCTLSAEQIATRGRMCALLVLAMSRQRRVNLRITCAMEYAPIIFDMGETIDLGAICAVLCNPVFFRRAVLGYCLRIAPHSPRSIPFDDDMFNDPRRYCETRGIIAPCADAVIMMGRKHFSFRGDEAEALAIINRELQAHK